jgi:hypothetical protein
MNKLFNWLTGEVFEKVGKALDGLFTSDEERIRAKNEVFKVFAQQSSELDKLRTTIIQAEAKGNWLQRSWRPIIMLAFGFIVLYSKFIAPAFGLPNTDLDPDFWDLLRLGLGGYVIGRSAEKITSSIVKNIEFKRKTN